MGLWSDPQITKKEFDIIQGKYYTWQTSLPILNAATRKIIFDPLLLFGITGTIALNFYINHS